MLVKWHTDLTNLTDSNKSLPQMTQINTDLDALRHELKYLGLWKFVQAVMFVMKEVFGLSEDRMIAPMDEREGRFLLDESCEEETSVSMMIEWVVRSVKVRFIVTSE